MIKLILFFEKSTLGKINTNLIVVKKKKKTIEKKIAVLINYCSRTVFNSYHKIVIDTRKSRNILIKFFFYWILCRRTTWQNTNKLWERNFFQHKYEKCEGDKLPLKATPNRVYGYQFLWKLNKIFDYLQINMFFFFYEAYVFFLNTMS